MSLARVGNLHQELIIYDNQKADCLTQFEDIFEKVQQVASTNLRHYCSSWYGVYCALELEQFFCLIRAHVKQKSPKESFLVGCKVNDCSPFAVVYDPKNKEWQKNEKKITEKKITNLLFEKASISPQEYLFAQIEFYTHSSEFLEVKESFNNLGLIQGFKELHKFNYNRALAADRFQLLFESLNESPYWYIQEMLVGGVDVNRGNRGFNPLDLLRDDENSEIFGLLYDYGGRKKSFDAHSHYLMRILGYPDLKEGSCNGASYKCLESILIGESSYFFKRMSHIISLSDFLDLEEDCEKKYQKELLQKHAEHLQEGLFLELLAFFDSLHAYYRDGRYHRELLSLDEIHDTLFFKHRTFIPEIPMLAQSKVTDEMGGISPIFMHSFLLQRSVFQNFLQSYRDFLEPFFQQSSFPLYALQLNIKNHSVVIGYDHQKDLWIYFNNNFNHRFFYDDLSLLIEDILGDCFYKTSDNIAFIARFWMQTSFSDRFDITSKIENWGQNLFYQEFYQKALEEVNSKVVLNRIFKQTSWLINSVFAGDIKTIEMLLTLDHINVDIQDAQGSTALIEAVKLRNFDIVQLLLFRGADPLISTREGYDAFLVALMRGYKDIERLLERHGATVEKSWWLCCENGNFRGVKFFLENRTIDINEQDDEGNSSLMLLCEGDYLDSVSFLLQKTPDLFIENNRGEDAFLIAIKNKSVEMLKLLLKSVLSSPERISSFKIQDYIDFVLDFDSNDSIKRVLLDLKEKGVFIQSSLDSKEDLCLTKASGDNCCFFA